MRRLNGELASEKDTGGKKFETNFDSLLTDCDNEID